jgi:GTP-binding protein
MFVDEVDIHVAAGNGGRGCLAFRREKSVPRGGPSGGDGGHGGSVYVVASPHTNTLINYRFHPELVAERGEHGQGSNRTGSMGADLELPVPIGTLVYEKTQDPEAPPRLLADLAEEGQRVLVAKGGRGGMGNARFASSTNRAPRKVQPGEAGEEKNLRLELKLLADVGLVGFPNAGKSTLISHVSAARPKIADYPFTTLTPNLGVVGLSNDRSFVVADVPGLIEGAHRGHGLGHQFLRHLERTKVLVHVVDVSGASGRSPVEDLDTVRRELELFQPELAAKPQLVAANKIDAVDDEHRVQELAQGAKALGLPFFRISAVVGTGLPELLEMAWSRLATAREEEAEEKRLRLGRAVPGDPSTLREPQGRPEQGRGATRSGSTRATSRVEASAKGRAGGGAPAPVDK